MKKLFVLLAMAVVLIFSQTGIAADGDPILAPIDLTGDVGSSVLPVANGGTNSSTALNNDFVMVSSGGAVIESATISAAELALLNGMASVSTGVANNDKLVTQGYVDDNAGVSGSFGSSAAKTVASGIIDISDGSNYALVTGEGNAADAVTEIAVSAVGDIIVFQGKSGLAYDITFTDGTYLKLPANFIMNNEYDNITLMVVAIGTNDTCMELSRVSNG